jgi:hypothetical protein
MFRIAVSDDADRDDGDDYDACETHDLADGT